MPRSKILVVDDDADLKEALEVWFAQKDCDVQFASNGQEGLAVLRSGQHVDLVLSDFMMPELNGIELLRLVKSSQQLFGTRMVMMSSNLNPEFRKRAVELGAVDYLSKADTAKTIVEKAMQVLQGPGAAPAHSDAAPPDTSLPLAEIRLAAESLLQLMEVIGLVENVPPAAASAVAAARKLAARVHELVGSAKLGSAK